MAADAAGLMRALELAPAHIVGASMGGMIAQTLAAEHPQTVRSLVSIMSTTGNRWKGQPAFSMYRYLLRRAPDDRQGFIEYNTQVFEAIGSRGLPFDRERVRDMVARSYDRGHDPAGPGRQLGAIIASGDRTEQLHEIRVPDPGHPWIERPVGVSLRRRCHGTGDLRGAADDRRGHGARPAGGGVAAVGGGDRGSRPGRRSGARGRAAQRTLTPGKAERAHLRDGATVLIRPIGPEDRELLRSGFERLSDRSRYMRFQAPLPALSEKQLSYFTEVDHHDHEALIAIDPDTGDIVGVVRYVRVEDRVAECAVVVGDDWQGRGLGTELLDRLVERAREEGVDRFLALVLAENAEALRLLQHLGDTVQRREGSQVELDIELPAPQQTSPQIKLVLASAARGLVIPAISMWRQVADFTHAHRRAEAVAEPANAIVAHAYAVEGDAPAVSVAAGLATARHAHVHLVDTYWPVVSDREEIDRRLAATADDLRRRGLEVSTHLIGGDTVDAVIDVAEQTEAALIVIDARAASVVTPWRAYSLPSRVCARAPCDVLLAR